MAYASRVRERYALQGLPQHLAEHPPAFRGFARGEPPPAGPDDAKRIAAFAFEMLLLLLVPFFVGFVGVHERREGRALVPEHQPQLRLRGDSSVPGDELERRLVPGDICIASLLVERGAKRHPKYASRRPESAESLRRAPPKRASARPSRSRARPRARARTSPKCPRARARAPSGRTLRPRAPDRVAFFSRFFPILPCRGACAMGAAPTAPRNRVTTALEARGISISALARASGPGASAGKRARRRHPDREPPRRPALPTPLRRLPTPPAPAPKSRSRRPRKPPPRGRSGQFGQRDTGLARGITSSSENARSHAFSRPTQASPDAAMVAGRRIEPG